MSVFYIEGKVDKRILVLPLIRVCSIDGPTILISDDGSYKNLYHEQGNKGTISGVDISIGNTLSDATEGIDKDEYRHIVYVTSDQNKFNEDIDLVISCKCYDRSIFKKTVFEEEIYENKMDVVFSMIPVKNVTNLVLLKPSYYKYLIETEEKKELLINKDKQLCMLMTSLFSKQFNMKSTQFFRLLTRPTYELSAK